MNNTIPEIMYVIKTFSEQGINYILFKCDHIFQGQNKNLDIIFHTSLDFHKAQVILKNLNFSLRLSEKIEKYKEMWTGHLNAKLISIHLHKEVAWHGLKAIEKGPLFQRMQQPQPYINLPSLEDSILIHAGHILFENFKITQKEQPYFNRLNLADQDYLNYQLTKNNWQPGFWKLVSTNQVTNADIVHNLVKKISKEPVSVLYLSKKLIQKIFRKRKGCLISFIGVNGSGKSTASRKLLERFEETNLHLGNKQSYYYFGWKPTMPLTKWLSNKMQKKTLFKEAIKPKEGFNLLQELNFTYQFIEFLYRYYVEVKPQLRQGNLVVTDRYFYDLFGQYPYAKKSLIMPWLMKTFPKPNYTYLLEAPVEVLQSRKKVDKTEKLISEQNREVFPAEYLTSQMEDYSLIAKLVPLEVNGDIEKIHQQTWRSLL